MLQLSLRQMGLVENAYPKSVEQIRFLPGPYLLRSSPSPWQLYHFQQRTVPLLKGLGLSAGPPEDTLGLQVTATVCSQLHIATQNGRGTTALGEPSPNGDRGQRVNAPASMSSDGTVPRVIQQFPRWPCPPPREAQCPQT